MKKLMALTALMILTACDYAERREMKRDRASGDYRAAMSDFQAGRIDAAIAGFRKVISKDPANAEARFQLAYLLQDSKKQYIEAYCAYREYLSQRPESDKSGLAQDRVAACERAVAQELATKYSLNQSGVYQQEAAHARAALDESEKKVAQLEKDMADLIRRNMVLSTERDRLLSIVKGEGDREGKTSPMNVVRDAKSLLEEDEDETDRIKSSVDIAALRSEESEELGNGSSLLPERTEADLKRREEAEALERQRQKAIAEQEKANAHPATYVVQEGDTLFKIALRFYRHTSAWTKIRDANKALISSDGRVRAGDTIKLP